MCVHLTLFRDAVLSEDGIYRYTLSRSWGAEAVEHPTVCWILLNPSTATALTDDPTVRKCIGFTKRWGCDSLVMVNLFALRSTDPREMRVHPAPMGPENRVHVIEAIRGAGMAIAAWGAFETGQPMINIVQICQRAAIPLRCLGFTRSGAPRHPCRLAYDTELVAYDYDLAAKARR